MKRGIVNKIVIISTMIFLIVSANAFAEEEAPTASADLGLVSTYMWRGWKLSEDKIVVQPSMSISHKGLGFNAWSSLSSDPSSGDSASETDFTVSYDTNAGPLGIGIGYIYYDLEQAAPGIEDDFVEDSQEFYLSASYDTILAPSLTLYRDFISFPGYYISLGLGHSIEIADSINLDFSGAFGYYMVDDDSGLQDGLLSASISIPVTEYISLSPSVSYSFPLSDDAEDFLGHSGEVFGGVVLSFSF
ncbi:MAG: hypothetical protein JW944_00895 [Deltaproteobacteria bacterium]|nr:hypothetical protein [Deltaproteobacteria bacterium]